MEASYALYVLQMAIGKAGHSGTSEKVSKWVYAGHQKSKSLRKIQFDAFWMFVYVYFKCYAAIFSSCLTYGFRICYSRWA